MIAARHPGRMFTCLLLHIVGLLCVRGRARTDATGQGNFSGPYFGGCGISKRHTALCKAHNISSH